uniref:Venom protein 59.1 n=1 Tax=Lychas mucronatus TaxID=172552 RepID=VP59_LYCMC|nr:RecName: Full=Venom protein 59.1; Flags: Precursor [Lychas mucronatus]
MNSREMFCVFILFASFFYCSYAEQECNCDKSCEPVKDCTFGTAMDKCGCCEVCAVGIGHFCGKFFNNAVCAEGLKCAKLGEGADGEALEICLRA